MSQNNLNLNKNNSPLWKQLGFASYRDYINSTSGANGDRDTLTASVSSTPSLAQYSKIANGGVNQNIAAINAINNQSPSPIKSDFGSSYVGESNFLDWYKNNYGSDYADSFERKEGMSDADWEIGNKLYDAYKQSTSTKNRYDADVQDLNRNYDSAIDKAGSDRDYSRQEAENLYENELNKLQERYGQAMGSLDTSKRQSQQNASMTLDKLKKYLPMQIKSQGLGGLGVSESTMLQAYNNYANNMGEIESDYNTNKTNLDTSYNETKAGYDSIKDSAINSANKSYDDTVGELNTQREQALSDLLKNYNQSQENIENSARESAGNVFDKYQGLFKQEQADNAAKASGIIENSTSENADEIFKQFEGLNLSDADKDVLRAQAETKAAENRQVKAFDTAVVELQELISDEKFDEAQAFLNSHQEIFGQSYYDMYGGDNGIIEGRRRQKEEADKEEEAEKTNERILAGQEPVKAPNDGKSYRLDKKIASNANEIRNNNSFKDQLKKLGFTDPYSKDIPNGTTFEIKCDASGSDKTDYKDFLGWLLGPTNIFINHSIYHKKVTYYNGEWYFSK